MTVLVAQRTFIHHIHIYCETQRSIIVVLIHYQLLTGSWIYFLDTSTHFHFIRAHYLKRVGKITVESIK